MPPNETTLDFDEHTLDQPEIIDADAFPDYCLDLYDTIKFGKRKERKRAAQKLVLFAVELAASLDKALDDLHAVQVLAMNEVHKEGNNGSPWMTTPLDQEGPMAPSYPATPSTEEARPEPTCVLNEHAHGDGDGWVMGQDGWTREYAMEKAPPAGTDDARGSS